MKRPKYEWDLTPGFIARFAIAVIVLLALLWFGGVHAYDWLLGLVDR